MLSTRCTLERQKGSLGYSLNPLRASLAAIAIVLPTLFYSATPYASPCDRWLTLASVLTHQLEDYRGLHYAKLDTHIGDASLRRRLSAQSEGGFFLVHSLKISLPEGTARMDFRLIDGTDALVIDSTYVPVALRGQGLSRELLKRALEAFPHIQRILTFLDEVNSETFSAASLHATSHQAATFWQTPRGRVLSQLGFQNLTHLSLVEIRTGPRTTKAYPHAIVSR